MGVFMLEEKCELQQQAHKSRIDAKCYIQINSDDALANHLLKLATRSTVRNQRRLVVTITFMKCIMMLAF